ncbi:MAG: aminotransferase class I/II-fold pyridoxal phosphate-dependent enzyme [Deltaproteobacteria bacterium]|nr:aminotransferase class I/II-fold pyridoxal phosphate-dependent enzyme [Deltaproteobacteria bacterium]
MNPLARELNDNLSAANENVFSMLSSVGKSLFFPKGILAQSAEAKEKAHRHNATIGIATEGKKPMYLKSVMGKIPGIDPSNCLTYAPSFGLLELRKLWQEALFKKNPGLSGKTVSLPVVTQAITHGICVFGEMFVDPGDVVILPDQMWGNYNLILNVRRGARISQYALFDEMGGFNLKAFEAKIKEEAAKNGKIIALLNFPQNPTGYTLTKSEASAVKDILVRTAESGVNVVALCDDAYFGLFYEDDCMEESLFAGLSGAHERLLAVKLDGATKEDFVWGLRVGFITYGAKFAQGKEKAAYEALERKTAGAVRGTISNASHLSQSIVLAAMKSPEYAAEKAEKFGIMKDRAFEVKKVLADPSFGDAWSVYPFNSGYFMCLKLKTVPADELRVHILNEYGVGVIALGRTDIRVAFSCLEKDDVKDIFEVIYRGVKDLEKKGMRLS